MAGPGTDIKLEPEIAARGGLHVIVAERNDSRRVDRQLVGRSARQGDPGSFECFVSVEDEVPGGALPRWLCTVLARFARSDGRLPACPGPLASGLPQSTIERLHARMRRDLLRLDRRLADVLAISAEPD